jgi:hypothetical protein
MKRENKILTLVAVFCLIISIQSCKKSPNNINVISIPNDSIKGLAFIGESKSSVNYSPKGNFIQVIKPDSGFWKNMVMSKSNQIVDSKLFFHDDDIKVSFIYDSLNEGEYNLKFISGLKDTIAEKLNFKKSIELTFPKKLNEFYKEVGIRELEIDNLKVGDTLQLLYQRIGCFGGAEWLIEFNSTDNDRTNLRKMITGYRSVDEPEHEWIHPVNENVKERLSNFIFKVKNLTKSELDLCSSFSKYTFRVKGSNTIYIVEDNSCELFGEMDRLLDPN